MVNLVVFIILIIGITSHNAYSAERPMFAFQARNKCKSISPDYVNPYENRPTLCEFFSIVDRIGQTVFQIQQKANVKIELRPGASMCRTLFPETRFLFPRLKEKICALFKTFRLFPILCRKKEKPQVSTQASQPDTEPPTTSTTVSGDVSFPSTLTSTWSPTTRPTEPSSTQISTVTEGPPLSSTSPTLGTTELTTIIIVTKPSTLPTTPEAPETDSTTSRSEESTLSTTESTPTTSTTLTTSIPDSPTTTLATSITPSGETDPMSESTPTEEPPSSESTVAETAEDEMDASSSPEELSSVTSGTFDPPTESDFSETVSPDGRANFLSKRSSNFLSHGRNSLDLHIPKLWLFSPQSYLNGAIKHIFRKFGDDAGRLMDYRRELESFQMNLTNGNFPETAEEKRIARSLADKIEKESSTFDSKIRDTHYKIQKSYNRVSSGPIKGYMRELLRLLELADELPELAICSLVNKQCPTGLIKVFVH